MVLSQLKVRYSGSFLGLWLAIVQPLLLLGAITFAFSVILKVSIPNFPFFVLSAILPWLFFANAVSEASISFNRNSNILHQFVFPREFIPLSIVGSNFVQFLLGWCCLAPLFFFYHHTRIIFIPWIVIGLIALFLFVAGLGLLMAVLTVFFRDVEQLLSIIFMLWFWVTPIFYSVDMVPVRLRWVFIINPMTPYIQYFRVIFFYGESPRIIILCALYIWAIMSVLISLFVFSAAEKKIIKRI